LIPLIVLVAVAIVVIAVAAARASAKPRTRRRIAVIGTVAVVVVTLPISVVWGMWTVAAVRCGHPPVTASRFAAAYSYALPGDSGYNLGLWPIIVPEYYCSAADAEANGFNHIP
jgi:uncharacterized membrane protein